jgi:hypothetical protein
VTEPGAFAGHGEVPISAYGHSSWNGTPPIGKGTIRETKNEAIVKAQFFMEQTLARDTFVAVKELGEMGEWSYGYDPTEFAFGEFNDREVRFLTAVKVHEVSPVLVGAGVGTRTLQAKRRDGAMSEFKAAIRPHGTQVTAREWDGAAVAKAIPEGSTIEDFRSVFAWVDTFGDPESKSSYRFPHHHGVGGPANVRACIATIAALNSGKARIPDADRKGVYEHVASHLRDADREPPELREKGADGSLKLHEEGLAVVDAIESYLTSVGRVAALRTGNGKQLSQLNTEVLAWVGEDLDRLSSELRRLKDSPREAVARDLVRFLHFQQEYATP